MTRPAERPTQSILAPSLAARRWGAAAVAWLLVIGWCTLRSAPDQVADIAGLRWYCVICGDSGVADVFLNILLFLPVGLALHGMKWPLWRTALTVAAISTGIECFQAALLIGRDASLGDVLSNTTGGVAGWFTYGVIGMIRRPRASTAKAASVSLLALMAGIWFATGAGYQPSLSDDVPWIGQPMHEGRGKQPFPGTLQQASFDGIFIPNETMDRHAPWRDSIAIEVDATRSNATRFADAIVMLRIVDTNHVPQVVVDQIGDDARLRLRVRASDWALHNPRWRVGHAMAMTPGQPWRFRWSWLRDRLTIVNEPIAGPAAARLEVPLSIGIGWAFIHPFVSIISRTRLLWTSLWLLWWFGLAGWLGGHAGARWAAWCGAVAVSSFVAASWYWGFALQPAEIVVAVAGFAVAAALATTNARGSRHE